METPKSPPHSQPQSPNDSNHAATAITDAAAAAEPTPNESPSPIPLNSPLRTHPKRLLPPQFASTYPHGHLSGHPRSPTTQAAFDARRKEILATMTAVQIEERYEEVAVQVKKAAEEAEWRGKMIDADKEKVQMDRDVERRVWGRLKGVNGGKAGD